MKCSRWIIISGLLSSVTCQASFSKDRYIEFYDEFLAEEEALLHRTPVPTPPSPPPPSPPPPSPPPPSPPPPSPPPTPTPPAPQLNYAPIVIVNNTGLNPDRIYFLGTGKNLGGTSAHFLKPDLSTGVCSYASPATYNSADPDISVKLSELPSSGSGCYLIYLPQQISGRCYLSIDAPLYLQTGATTIGSPSVTSSKDPNYYTLYQNFELTLDSSYNLYANISNVDFYCLPMGLASFSYPSGSAYPTVQGLTFSGFAETTGRQSILTSVGSALSSEDDSSPKQWYNLVVPFYDDPYTDALPTTDLRILAAKDSITFSTGVFIDALHPQGAFNSQYLQSTISGPSSGSSYMQVLGNFYTGTTLQFTIYPQGQPSATYTMSGTTGTTLHLAVDSGSGASNVDILLNNLTTLDLLGGDVGTWNADGAFDPPGTNVWYTEIAKLFSALFTAGQLPPNTTHLPEPILSEESYFINYRNYYFSNPSGFSQHGPWFNLYNSAMHPLMVLTGGSGLGYAYDYDDLLGLGGEMQVVIQTGTALNTDYPYYAVYAGPIDTVIPDAVSSFGPYSLTVNPITTGSEPINIIYSTSPGSAPSISVAVPEGSSPALVLPTVYDYFEVEYVTHSKTYKVYPKHQLVLPTTTSYTQTDADLMSDIAFISVSGSGAGFTISLPSL